MDGQERERVRQRGLDAERNRKERQARMLEKAPKPGTGAVSFWSQKLKCVLRTFVCIDNRQGGND